MQGNIEYTVYICSGQGKNYREYGTYTARGNTYLDAVNNFVAQWNKCSPIGQFGSGWAKKGRRKGNPKQHHYLQNTEGQRLLLIPNR